MPDRTKIRAATTTLPNKPSRVHFRKAWAWLNENKGLIVRAKNAVGIRDMAPFDEVFSDLIIPIAVRFANFDESKNASFETYAFHAMRWLFMGIARKNTTAYRFGITQSASATRTPKRVRLPQLLDDAWAEYDRLQNEDQAIQIIKSSSKIDERCKKVMFLRQLKGQTLQSIGDQFKRSKDRIRQIEFRGYRQARELLERHGVNPNEL